MEYMISVITATFNSEGTIRNLIDSLMRQTDQDFYWIVADGGSNDKTVDIINSSGIKNVDLVSEPDFGIYDALNKAVVRCKSEYYVVIGSDDTFYCDAIENFKKNIMDGVDIVAANILFNGKLSKPKNKPIWLVAQMAFISSHSAATLIRTALHDELGFYSRKYPIAADQDFIMKVGMSDDKNIIKADFIAGCFNREGVSSVDKFGALIESFRVRVDRGLNKYVQFLIFFYKFIFK